VKFPPFDYVRAGSVAEAVGCLANDEDAKVLAGGQSLLPLMAMRLARPSVLVDIGGTHTQARWAVAPQDPAR
jgi:aerobic carbon-monoxide dehydrogenase medium subunit